MSAAEFDIPLQDENGDTVKEFVPSVFIGFDIPLQDENDDTVRVSSTDSMTDSVQGMQPTNLDASDVGSGIAVAPVLAAPVSDPGLFSRADISAMVFDLV